MEGEFADLERIDLLPAGAELFGEGDFPRGLHVIHDGEVELVFSGRSGVAKALRIASRGAVLGLGDAIALTPHDCTARTRTPARIGFIPLADLSQVLEQHPSLWLSVAQILSADVSSCWDSMRRLNARP
jgi:CRP-like cAMP-binding protein